MRHTSTVPETSLYISLSVFPFSLPSLSLAPLAATSAILPLAFTSNCTASVRLCPLTTKQPLNARTSVSRNRDRVCVRVRARVCVQGLRECVPACVRGYVYVQGFNGPS